jgi:hypothetical protein
MLEALATVVVVILMFVPIVNIVTGLIAGWMIGGPLGAIIGLVIGFVITGTLANYRT